MSQQTLDAPADPAWDHVPEAMDLPLMLAIARLTHGISPASVGLAYSDWLLHLALSPSWQSELGASALGKWLQWLEDVAPAWRGDGSSYVTPQANDKRFSAPEWRLPPFNLVAQAFLLNQQWWGEATAAHRGVSRHHQEVASFITRQWLDMASPSNFVWSNPQVLKSTALRGGGNLVEGFMNWARDATAVVTDGTPRGIAPFQPGVGTALTPGKVVYRNHLIELIQYDASTPEVAAEPVLIVPSWIMKYYILDLTPGDSLVQHLVGQGHTVFMVSWRNPASADRNLGLEDYVSRGVLQAIEAVHRIRPGAPVHAAGYCLGGTLLAMAAAVLARGRGNPLKSVSLLAAQVDFNEPGELGLFIDESQIAFLESVMAEHGYLDGRRMAGAFQLINSKDLVWSKLVHEYLMGAETPMTALKAWNADATRLPARMHSEYLRRLYLHNDLAEGRYLFDGVPLRLDAIGLPLFVVATERDHVSPWHSVYKIHHLADAPVTFALSSGGHNVGIVSPPAGPLAHPQASYRIAFSAAGAAPADPQRWVDEAASHAGSWWSAWSEWLERNSSGRRVHPAAQKALLHEGAPLHAPGTYVHQR